jgi:hypothetical protein
MNRKSRSAGTSARTLPDHLRLEVAGAAGRDLPGGYALGPDPLGVALGLDVALDDGHPEPALEPPGQRFEEGRLPRPGRAHQVDGQDTLLPELRPDLAGDPLVGPEDVPEDEELTLFHGIHDNIISRSAGLLTSLWT